MVFSVWRSEGLVPQTPLLPHPVGQTAQSGPGAGRSLPQVPIGVEPAIASSRRQFVASGSTRSAISASIKVTVQCDLLLTPRVRIPQARDLWPPGLRRIDKRNRILEETHRTHHARWVRAADNDHPCAFPPKCHTRPSISAADQAKSCACRHSRVMPFGGRHSQRGATNYRQAKSRSAQQAHGRSRQARSIPRATG